MENGVEPRGKKVLLLGAGGAARAIAYTLAQEADELVILNRTVKQAAELANLLKQVFNRKVAADALSPNAIKDNLEDSDVLINATSVGMKPNANQTPVAFELLKPDLAVMDIVYNPLETKLAKDAKVAGAKVVSGVEMLIYQGAASFEIWTGHSAPVEVMRRAMLNHLLKV
jgi:shikimate dehydrogenase